MPEGHSIHRVAAALHEKFAGKEVQVSSPQGRFAASAQQLNGRELDSAWAWGKHLFLEFGADTVHVHLGLYGSWRFAGGAFIGAPRRVGEGDETAALAGIGENTRLLLEWEEESAALSGPTACELLTGDEVARVLDRLGPDPIRAQAQDRQQFIRNMRARKSPIGVLVMNQECVAGPGNIYRAESLFRTGISPLRPGARISEKRLGILWDDLVYLMRKGVEEGRIITRRDDEGDVGEPRFWVYQRAGEKCLRCSHTVATKQLNGRQLYWCPGCQH